MAFLTTFAFYVNTVYTKFFSLLSTLCVLLGRMFAENLELTFQQFSNWSIKSVFTTKGLRPYCITWFSGKIPNQCIRASKTNRVMRWKMVSGKIKKGRNFSFPVNLILFSRWKQHGHRNTSLLESSYLVICSAVNSVHLSNTSGFVFGECKVATAVTFC